MDVARNWRGIGLLYMILLLVLTWTPILIKTQVSFSRFANVEAPKLVKQVPTITITSGVVSIDKPEPYTIVEPDSGRVIAIIDTTGEVTTPPLPSGILLTRNSIIMRQADGSSRTTDLSQVKSFKLDQARINGWLSIARGWFFPIAVVAMVGFSTCWRLLLMLIGGAIGLLFASGFKATVSFAASMRLAAIAMTPGILLDTVLRLLGISIYGCFGPILGIGLFLLFIALAMKANAPQTPPHYAGFPVILPTHPQAGSGAPNDSQRR